MLQRALFVAVFFYSACVTVNIYFPAAAVERAADQIVKETWGGPAETEKAPPAPQSRRSPAPTLPRLSFVGTAHAQEADINVSNPAIRALKESIKRRSQAIKPYMDPVKDAVEAAQGLAAAQATGLSVGFSLGSPDPLPGQTGRTPGIQGTATLTFSF